MANTIELIADQKRQIEDIILPEKKECLRRNKKDLEALEKRVRLSKKDMIEELKELNNKKINAIRAASMDNFKDVIEDEIGILPGKEGYVLNDEINNIFIKYVEKFSCWTIELGEKFQSEYDKQNEAIDSLLKTGAFGASKGLKVAGQLGVGTIKNGIFAGRELLGKLGVVIKFKPWQVTKLATFATKALPVIGAALDVVTNIIENISVQERNRKFEKNKDDLKTGINETFREVNEMLKSDDVYINQFAPSIGILIEQINQDDENIKYQESVLKKFNSWNEEILNSDFSIL